jgi:hypothetical protein
MITNLYLSPLKWHVSHQKKKEGILHARPWRVLCRRNPNLTHTLSNKKNKVKALNVNVSEYKSLHLYPLFSSVIFCFSSLPQSPFVNIKQEKKKKKKKENNHMPNFTPQNIHVSSLDKWLDTLNLFVGTCKMCVMWYLCWHVSTLKMTAFSVTVHAPELGFGFLNCILNYFLLKNRFFESILDVLLYSY